MRLWLIVFCLVTSVTLFARPAIMTRSTFENIEVGTSLADLEGCIGKPASVCRVDDETEEFKYIERFNVGAELNTENQYFLTVRNGQVIAKRVVYFVPPSYDLIYKEDPNNLVN